MKAKIARVQTIREILQNQQISNQTELLNLLIEKGFDITQATLSRNLKEMRVFKAKISAGEYTYKLPSNELRRNLQPHSFAAKSFISLDFSGNIAVIKTRPGYAGGIASEIDERTAEETLGSVAGDDTILVVMKKGVTPKALKTRLADFISGLN